MRESIEAESTAIRVNTSNLGLEMVNSSIIPLIFTLTIARRLNDSQYLAIIGVTLSED